MSYELDMSQYMDLFLQEASEQLEILEQETLKLEKEPSQDRLQVIFRAAHTLKGSARAMGFQAFAELTHEMENVLDNLRSDKLKVTSDIADALLNCLDTLNEMRESIGAGNGDKLDVSALVARLAGFLGSEAAAASEATQNSNSDAPTEQFTSKIDPHHFDELDQVSAEQPVFHAKFRLDDSCAMKFVRAFMAISEIQKEGELLVSHPSHEALEEEQFELDFELVFQSGQSLDAWREKFAAISEVSWFDVHKWQRPAEVQVAEAAVQSTAPTLEVIDAIAPTTESAAPAQAAKKTTAETGQTVRVDVARLDILMNLVGELVIDRTRIAQIGTHLASRYQDGDIEALSDTVSHISRITSDLQDQIMKARMMPIESVFNRFPRVVRDLAQKLGKEVQLEVSGGETELDRTVIEVIGDPLLHILRNSIDHGLELPDEREKLGKPRTGVVKLSASHQENHIVIEIHDDGKGIDIEKVKSKAVGSGLITADSAAKLSDKEALQLIFASGLSTAAEVSEVSGRGVGMDIVRSNIQKLGGLIDMDTVLGEGTSFTMRLPLTLAIIRGLLVRTDSTVLVIPLGSVVETLLVDPGSIQTINRKEVIVIRGRTTPLVRMRDVFSKKTQGRENTDSSQLYVVIIGLAEQRIGVVVDDLIGESEVVIKSLSRFCGDIAGISGATILGDGNVALIMDVNGIVARTKMAA